ncbi:hypothetical protein HPP92_024804 [Vanilla planifolia]|uniref:Endonuclease/exonuclease/phosphatase domain-containing protein n=1 Tax=Vanilla planifolia TaxID=51239 RepID=A0A835UBI1_VANPL|nr:hypothetical protein HPP92_024804 [Vanilla planifolia]
MFFLTPNGDIKLGQVRIFLQEAYALSEKWGRIPVVLAGDFNSTPQSAIYEFLLTSELNITQHDRKSLSGQERLKHSFHDLYRYSTGLECARVLDTLTIASLRGLGGLPNKTIGSDHLALAAEFVFNSRSTGPNLSSEAAEKEGSQGEDN